jgi:pyruvate,water dikinase
VTKATVLLNGTAVEPSSVGGKGFALNRLIGMGATVPPTGSITTDGYRWFVHGSGLYRFIDDLRAEGLPDQIDLDRAAERVDAAFLEAPMPGELAAEIRQLAVAVGEGDLLAVRSSATAEDMAAASFAGQYRSYLEIGNDDGLFRAVRLVWASLWLPAPRSYRVHTGVSEDDLAMSVVVMRLVDAERAGVVFTVNPAGSGSDLRIEAVEGLAEQLVSGEVTPEAYVLPRAAARRPPVDHVLDQAIEVALDLERGFGDPQDVEWAHDGERLYIVQSRPITTISAAEADDGFDTPIGPDDAFTTAGIAETLPGVLPPLQWTTAAPLLENGFRQLFDQMNALPPAADRRPFIARIRGRAVLSLDLMKAAAAEVPGGSGEEIERQYFGRVISEPVDPPQTRALRDRSRGCDPCSPATAKSTHGAVSASKPTPPSTPPSVSSLAHPTATSPPPSSCWRTGTGPSISPVVSWQQRSPWPLPQRRHTVVWSSSSSLTSARRRRASLSSSRRVESIPAEHRSHCTPATWRNKP